MPVDRDYMLRATRELEAAREELCHIEREERAARALLNRLADKRTLQQMKVDNLYDFISRQIDIAKQEKGQDPVAYPDRGSHPVTEEVLRQSIDAAKGE